MHTDLQNFYSGMSSNAPFNNTTNISNNSQSAIGNALTALNNALNNNQKNNEINQISTPRTPGSNKRIQVPKACANCRKSHAACDLERPCKRCMQNGLDSTCSDIPRKKRASKKRMLEVGSPNMTSASPLLTPKDDDWEDQFAELKESNKFSDVFGMSGVNPESIPQHLQPVNSIHRFSHTNPNNSIPRNNINQNTSHHGSIWPNQSGNDHHTFTPTYHYTTNLNNVSVNLGNNQDLQYHTEVNNVAPNVAQSPMPSPSSTVSVSSNELNFLISQINELRDANRSLEGKLQNVTKELFEMKNKKPPPSSSMLTNWHSFISQPDLAISVWKSTQVKGKNVLVECNEKFAQLLGYSIETLKNGFTSQKLINLKPERISEMWPEGSPNSGRDWPKRTQMNTAYGLKDVLVTINPVLDHFADCKYWIVHVLPVQPS